MDELRRKDGETRELAIQLIHLEAIKLFKKMYIDVFIVAVYILNMSRHIIKFELF